MVTEKADITITQQAGSLIQMPAGAKLADVVKALNSLGATPQDLLAILQAMKTAGALERRDRGDLTVAIAGLPSDDLSTLRTRAASDPKAAIKAAAKQFEALFMQQLMKSMREATMSSGMLDNAGTQMGTEMLDTQFANKMTGLPGGLGDVIARQLERQMTGSASTAAVLPAASAAHARRRATTARVSNARTEFLRTPPAAAREAEAQTGIPAAFMVAQAAHESGWGKHEIRNADGSSSHNLFGIKAGAGWTGPVAEITTTEYVGGEPQKVTAKFRAYASYGESFRDYARMMKESPRYAGVVAQVAAAPSRAGLRAGPAARRLRHRPGLRRQADARHQHHAAHATRVTEHARKCGMSSLMSIGKTAMSANYAALQTTGNNIANANTAGYSRQETQLADAPSQFTGSGFFGKGVNVATVTRAHSQLLTNQAISRSSTAAADNARVDKLTQLENGVSDRQRGRGLRGGEFLNSFVDVANKPQDASARQVALSQAQELAARFRAAGDQLSSLQTGVSQDMKAQVANVNTLAHQVADLNRQIANVRGTGHEPNDLLDQRDQREPDRGSLINVTTIAADDGIGQRLHRRRPEPRARRQREHHQGRAR